jgi:hypothetical protein
MEVGCHSRGQGFNWIGNPRRVPALLQLLNALYSPPIWRAMILVHTGSMTAICSSSLPSFRELSAQAQTLLFIYASATWARHHGAIPNSIMLVTELEKFWAAHQLSEDALSDADRMTCLLENHFESLRLDAIQRPSTKSKTCRSRLS